MAMVVVNNVEEYFKQIREENTFKWRLKELLSGIKFVFIEGRKLVMPITIGVMIGTAINNFHNNTFFSMCSIIGVGVCSACYYKPRLIPDLILPKSLMKDFERNLGINY
jgi:hypothetical protein